jgi:hypothetical protein
MPSWIAATGQMSVQGLSFQTHREAAVPFLIFRTARCRAQAVVTSSLLTIVPASGFARPTSAPAEKGCSAGGAQSVEVNV